VSAPGYRALVGDVDRFFLRVFARHGDQMQCAAGCSDCCRTRLHITSTEAAALTAHIAAMSPEARDHLAAIARRPVDDHAPRCAALDDDGRCLVYDARPVICRAYGLPIRFPGLGTTTVIDACPKNFTAHGADAVDPDCVLEQPALSALVMALEHAEAARDGRPPTGIDLGAVVMAAVVR
jgi:Fe-S-cluster containining protein